MKKILSLLMVLTMVFSLAACGAKDTEPSGGGKTGNDTAGKDTETSEPAGPAENKGKKLVVWTFTDEIEKMINEYYLRDNPDLGYEIEIVVIPNDQYQQKLDPVLGSGKSAPDVFALEAAFVKKYVNSDFTKDLKTLGIAPKVDETLQYVLDTVTDESGSLKGMSWQATPGAFFYRRSLAKKYLGVSEPEEVQGLLSDFDQFYEAAKTVNDKSGGETKLVSSLGDLQNVFLAARENGWVVDNKFVIDPKAEELLEIGKKLESEGLTNQAEQWTESWFASMSNDQVMGYFLPTWGLHYVLKSNAVNANTGESTSGDWGMIQGPSPYFWGGTWLTVREGTKMEKAAVDLINYIALNKDFLTEYAKKSGDFLAHQSVVESIKDSYSEEFLAGQNHYAKFAEMAPSIDASILTGSDLDINNLFAEQLTAYSKGEKDKETALADFKAGVQSAFPNLDY